MAAGRSRNLAVGSGCRCIDGMGSQEVALARALALRLAYAGIAEICHAAVVAVAVRII